MFAKILVLFAIFAIRPEHSGLFQIFSGIQIKEAEKIRVNGAQQIYMNPPDTQLL